MNKQDIAAVFRRPDMIAPLDGVKIRRYGEAIWIIVTEIQATDNVCEDDVIVGAIVSEPQHPENVGLSFRDRVACQRRHVVALAPWRLLPVEQRDRIKDDAITAENRKWKKQLIKALEGTSFAIMLLRARQEEHARKKKRRARRPR
jgi:hypothetical protein